MVGQARFSAAVQLGKSPTMKFDGELSKYVQFVNMFRNTFDNNITHSAALYEILMRHVYGLTKKALHT